MPSSTVLNAPFALLRSQSRAWSVGGVHALVAACIVVAAVATRLPALDATGLNEDEIDKLTGALAYRSGVFVVDGEHPALMKLAVLTSLETTDGWRRLTGSGKTDAVSIETAVRLPNVLLGAATSGVLYLLALQLFGPTTAVFAAWLWAFDVNAIAISRTAKEDTFALFFLLAAAWLFERGKAVGRRDPDAAQRWFLGAASMFGLMLASKYVPFLFGIHVLYFRLAEPHPGPNRPDKLPYLATLGLVALAANFPILLPGNWATIGQFLSEGAVQHSGYVFQGHIWPNAMSDTPGGIPIWFYLIAILTKMPLLVLACAALGLRSLIARGPERGSVFVVVFLVLTLVPYSLVATKFLRYLLPALAMIDLAAAVGLTWLAAAVTQRSAAAVRFSGTVVIVLALVLPAAAWNQSRPFAWFYRNALGQVLSPGALWFPPDELSDAGLREAVAELSWRAAPGDRIITEAPKAAAFYAGLLGRDDLEVVRRAGVVADRRDWLIVQPSHLYFENEDAVARARRHPAVFEVSVGGYRAVEVYRTW